MAAEGVSKYEAVALFGKRSEVKDSHDRFHLSSPFLFLFDNRCQTRKWVNVFASEIWCCFNFLSRSRASSPMIQSFSSGARNLASVGRLGSKK
jgi:hypothetical protein